MSGFLLDTNIPSELIRVRPEPLVRAWISAQEVGELFLSVVSFGEFRKGIALRPPGKRRDELETWLATDISTLFAGRILRVTRPLPSAGVFWRLSGNVPGVPCTSLMVRLLQPPSNMA